MRSASSFKRNDVTKSETRLAVCSFLALGLVAPAAKAASLQAVQNWGATGVPTDVSMYVYVPDKVAANPPILTLVHYCGGTAPAVFGQAQGGGLVKAADQYGFIIVAPSSGRCWDIVSNKTRTRDGGGDSHAIRQMVTYALQKYQANAARVYATGDSSGGMMTELLLALYPDVFKAGAAFAGMPAGCRGAGESGNGGGYSGACAGGTVTHSAQEWGDIARMLYPGYTGYRPRVQLFHGDADDIIKYPNHTEAIKEWSNVLGLGATPSSTEMGLTLGTHKATRQSWKNACGQVVLDAFTSVGGDHGPSDALFNASFVIPFLGLDKTGPVDPFVAQCMDGSGGAGGAGGTGGAGMPAGGASSGGSGNLAGTGGMASGGGAANAAGSGGEVITPSAGSGGAGPNVGGFAGSEPTPPSAGPSATPPADSSSCSVVSPGSGRMGGSSLLALGLALSARSLRRKGRASQGR